jgi:hypothetical protein
MKGRHLVLICLLAAAQAGAAQAGAVQAGAGNSDVRPQQVAVSLSGNTGSTRTAAITAQSLPKPSKLRRRPAEQANLADIGGGVVKEMRATSDFVQERAAKAGTADSWLIALSGFGLVVLQLRRKHKSLPQRRIAPYA